MSRPAGVCGVPLGVTAVCQAGVSLTQPQSNFTVPPMLGSKTCSTPFSPISLASSTMATTGQFTRLAMSTVSPRWSACPWVSRMAVGSSSEASTAAFGLPLRNGSTRTRVSPSDSSKAEWPRKRMSISGPSCESVPGWAFAGAGWPGRSEGVGLQAHDRARTPPGGDRRTIQAGADLQDGPLQRLEDRDAGAVHEPVLGLHEPDLRALDAALARAARQLLEDLADLEQRRGLRRVAEGEAAAAAVDVVQVAAGGRGRRVAALAQPHRLVGHQLGVGERAVDLEHVEVVAGAPGAGERVVGRRADPRVGGEVVPEGDEVGVVVALAPAGERGAGPAALAGDVLGGDDQRRGAVGPRRRLGLVDRWADEARAQDVVGGERLAQLGARV